MREHGGGVYVPLAAVGEVAAERVGVVHATGLRARLGDELARQSFESVKLPVLDLEVRYQGAASVRRKHSCLLWFSPGDVTAPILSAVTHAGCQRGNDEALQLPKGPREA